MEEIIKLKLDRIFPRVLITIKQDLGVMKIYFKLGNYIMQKHELYSFYNFNPDNCIESEK